MLPARVARLGAPLLLCPANLAPAASRRTVLVLHDAAALRHPAWYSGAYAAWQRRLLPVLARAGAADRDRVGVLARGARRAARRRPGAGVGRAGRGRRALHAGRGRGRRAPRARAGAAVRALRGLPHGAQEPRRARARGAGARGRRRRARGRGRAPAAVRGRAGPRRAAAARPRRRRAAARPLRGRRGVRAAVALRGLRAAGAGGDGGRHARARHDRRRAARDLRRRRAARRGPGGVRDRAAGAARRHAARASGCARPGWSARGRSPGSGRRARSTRC